MANEKRLIDANALKKRMFDYYECVNEHTSKSTYTGETLMDYEVAGLIEDCIDDAPTVDAVEVVHGRWIPSYTVDWWMGTKTIAGYTCNQCARHFKSKLKLNYCPNCGANMMDGDGNA